MPIGWLDECSDRKQRLAASLTSVLAFEAFPERGLRGINLVASVRHSGPTSLIAARRAATSKRSLKRMYRPHPAPCASLSRALLVAMFEPEVTFGEASTTLGSRSRESAAP